MADAELLDELRPGAFAIAYRMLGTVSEAEDVVQEALLRLHRAQAEGERIESPRAYVATVVTCALHGPRRVARTLAAGRAKGRASAPPCAAWT